VSYKEDSDEDKTGSEDLVEVEWNEAETPAEPDNAETIEKIISYRRGKKGGTEKFCLTPPLPQSLFNLNPCSYCCGFST
jgi:hypothetical protein